MIEGNTSSDESETSSVPQLISYEPNELETETTSTAAGDDDQDLFEPLDYRRDWSKEMRVTCANLIPHIQFDSNS